MPVKSQAEIADRAYETWQRLGLMQTQLALLIAASRIKASIVGRMSGSCLLMALNRLREGDGRSRYDLHKHFRRSEIPGLGSAVDRSDCLTEMCVCRNRALIS